MLVSVRDQQATTSIKHFIWSDRPRDLEIWNKRAGTADHRPLEVNHRNVNAFQTSVTHRGLGAEIT